jgi:hypothetical protein
VLINCRATTAAPDLQVAAEVSDVLDRRAALERPPVTMTISDPAALGIAGIFSSQSPSGRVFEQFYRKGSVDSDELIEAARLEQGYASPEGHAALYCLIGWARAQETRVPS